MTNIKYIQSVSNVQKRTTDQFVCAFAETDVLFKGEKAGSITLQNCGCDKILTTLEQNNPWWNIILKMSKKLALQQE